MTVPWCILSYANLKKQHQPLTYFVSLFPKCSIPQIVIRCQVLYFGIIFSCLSLKDTYCLSRMAENVLRLAINDVASGLLGDDQSLFTVAFLQTTAIVCHGLEALVGQLLGHHAKINIADPLFVQFVITACCMIEQVSKLLY